VSRTSQPSTAIESAGAHQAVQRLLEEQAALRRVATLVAQGVRPDEIFAAVSDEVGRLVGTDSATVVKFDDDGPAIVFVGVASNMSDAYPLGARWEFEDGMASAEVYRTGRSARGGARDWSTVKGAVGETHHRLGIVSTVASPIVVEGRLWGAVSVQSQEPLPPGTDERLEKFTELVATAIANAENRADLTRLAEEHAALRRVATLVARGVRPDEIFAAVSDEVGRLVGTDSATVIRYDDDGEGISYVGSASKVSGAFPVGVHWKFQDGMASFEVYRTGRSARSGAHLITVDGPIGEIHRRMGIISAVASPIVVEGRLWGAMAVHGREPLPPGTEERLEKFTELVATAIANAESRSQLAASRARLVAASDEARRRIERDLHDGAQQRLVSLGLELRMAGLALPPELDEPRRTMGRIADGLKETLEDLREISRGIHPAILSEGGLGPAMRALARRSAIPIELRADIEERLPESIEVAAYFVASEALTNTAKHAEASSIELSLATRNGSLRLSIRDDGVGGADPARGSGLVGLADRVEALGGTIEIDSALGGGTSLVVALPLEFELPVS
jgi:signal transduction histidine kinase